MKISASVLIALILAARLFAAENQLSLDNNHSHIEAAVRSTTDDFTAKVTAFDALVSVDLPGKSIGSAQLKFRLDDIKTGNEQRDAEMRAWLQTDQFPDCVYILDLLLPAAGGTFNARGKLILHGVTKAITIPVTVGFTSSGTCTIDGDLALEITDFSLSPIRRYILFTVNPELQVKFHLEGRVPSGS